MCRCLLLIALHITSTYSGKQLTHRDTSWSSKDAEVARWNWILLSQLKCQNSKKKYEKLKKDTASIVFYLPLLNLTCPYLVLTPSFSPPSSLSVGLSLFLRLICRSCSWTLSSTVSGKKQSDQCEKARGAHGQANQWWKEPCPGPYANGSTSRNLGSEHAH